MKLNFGNEPGKHPMRGKSYASEGTIRDSFVFRGLESVHQQTSIFLSVTLFMRAGGSIILQVVSYSRSGILYLHLRTATIRYLGIVHRALATVFLFLTWEAMALSLNFKRLGNTHAAAFAFSIDGSSDNFLAGWDWDI
jgi:hypothetical protein